MFVFLKSSHSILFYLSLCWFISIYLVPSWVILDYLGLSWAPSGYIELHQAILDYLEISWATLGYLRISWAILVLVVGPVQPPACLHLVKEAENVVSWSAKFNPDLCSIARILSQAFRANWSAIGSDILNIWTNLVSRNKIC